MANANPPSTPNDTRKVRAALMNKVCGDEDMFALGTSVARVVQMASSDDQGTHDLAYYVLSDVALTQRILRLSNTATYRTASGTSVTTISRAISLLGFDNVKTTALAMLLVDALSNSTHAQSVRVELEAALCASLVGREMARHSFYQGAEEASIGALFKNLGPLLVASHEHERYREINGLMQGGKHTIGQASQMILGCSYDALSEAVLAEWKIPDVIVRSLAAAAGRGAESGGQPRRMDAPGGVVGHGCGQAAVRRPPGRHAPRRGPCSRATAPRSISTPSRWKGCSRRCRMK
jgi:HD-like signal output (HDOD) protein